MSLPGVVIQFKADADKARRDIDKLTKTIKGVGDGSEFAGKKMAKMAKVGIAAVAAGAAVGAAALFKFAEAAVADADSQARLAKNLSNTTGATKKQVSAVEDWITRMGIAYGVVDDDLRPALARLARSTKSVTGAQKLSKLAMNISAATGKDMTTVAAALAKANDGNVNALKRLGITLGDNAQNAQEYNKVMGKLALANSDAAGALAEFGPNSKQYQTAMDKVNGLQSDANALAKAGIDWQKELAEAYKGSAKAAANTPGGTLSRIKLIAGEIGESVGTFVLPMLEEVSAWMAEPANVTKIQEWIDKIGEFSRKIGEEMVAYIRTTFIPFVENELIPAIKSVYDFFASPDGKAQIKSWGDALATLADAVGAVLRNLDKLFRLLDKLPGNKILQMLGLIPKLSDLTSAGTEKKPTYPRTLTTEQANALGSRNKSDKPANRSTVNVTIVNGRQEPSADSAALALRLARNLKGVA